jgi:hypothetical protein
MLMLRSRRPDALPAVAGAHAASLVDTTLDRRYPAPDAALSAREARASVRGGGVYPER